MSICFKWMILPWHQSWYYKDLKPICISENKDSTLSFTWSIWIIEKLQHRQEFDTYLGFQPVYWRNCCRCSSSTTSLSTVDPARWAFSNKTDNRDFFFQITQQELVVLVILMPNITTNIHLSDWFSARSSWHSRYFCIDFHNTHWEGASSPPYGCCFVLNAPLGCRRLSLWPWRRQHSRGRKVTGRRLPLIAQHPSKRNMALGENMQKNKTQRYSAAH